MLARATRRSIRSSHADAESAAACNAACAAASRRRRSASGPSPWRARPRGAAACRSRRNASWSSWLRLLHCSCRFLDRFVDLLVAGAAAQVPRDRFLDSLAARVRLALEQRLRRHQDPGGAVAALRAAEIGEGRLQRMQLAAARQPLDGLYRTAFA